LANLVPGMVRAMFTDPDAAGPMGEAIKLLSGPFVPMLKASTHDLSEIVR
jgi:4-hydroxy-tetrahydrodipicolinate synthase